MTQQDYFLAAIFLAVIIFLLAGCASPPAPVADSVQHTPATTDADAYWVRVKACLYTPIGQRPDFCKSIMKE